MYQHFNAWLDVHFFPTFRAVVTHRLFILGLLILGVVLMVDDNSIVQLKGGNFTNVCSAVLGCVVLLQQLVHHAENKRMHAKHENDMYALHAKVDALASPSTPVSITPNAPHAPTAPVADTPVQVVPLVRSATPAPARSAKGQFVKGNQRNQLPGGDAA